MTVTLGMYIIGAIDNGRPWQMQTEQNLQPRREPRPPSFVQVVVEKVVLEETPVLQNNRQSADFPQQTGRTRNSQPSHRLPRWRS
ncbi:uncharacterized protein LOC119595070 isoform X2 [Penaeus monodon]|uniref:uncharacterized protein LOC119595070 isoform X2 n=1 Tax=Penaeus monodon TaxID=6687 RepID=UPI0018A70913|nr:uncharacterized protein LOC119595070 isoform X2 [Penaeus monodon]